MIGQVNCKHCSLSCELITQIIHGTRSSVLANACCVKRSSYTMKTMHTIVVVAIATATIVSDRHCSDSASYTRLAVARAARDRDDPVRLSAPSDESTFALKLVVR